MMRRPGSWIVVDNATGKAIFETFVEKIAKAVNLTTTHRAIPAGEYLASLNARIRAER